MVFIKIVEALKGCRGGGGGFSFIHSIQSEPYFQGKFISSFACMQTVFNLEINLKQWANLLLLVNPV